MFPATAEISQFLSDPDIYKFSMSSFQTTESRIAVDILGKGFENGVSGVKYLYCCWTVCCSCMEDSASLPLAIGKSNVSISPPCINLCKARSVL